MPIRRALRAWFVGAMPGAVVLLTSLLVSCKRSPPPPPTVSAASASTSWINSVRKLDGAPTRVLSMHFAPDGASLLVLERRPPKDEYAGEPITYAISRRPLSGGTANDLMASTQVTVAFAPLGDAVVALQYPQVTFGRSDAPDPYGPERKEQRDVAWQQQALYRIDAGGAVTRISPEASICRSLISAAGGQWVAFSVDRPDRKIDYPLDAQSEVHVLGAKPGEEITLTVAGTAHDISADGARLLVLRPETPDASAKPLGRRLPRDTVKSMVIVGVKDQANTTLPTSLQIDGAVIDTAELDVWFLGDGLVFRSDKGELFRSALDGSKATRLASPLSEAADAGVARDASATGDGGATTDAHALVDAQVALDAPLDGGAPADVGAPEAKPQRVLGPKGLLLTLREEGGAVAVASQHKDGEGEPLAKLEGPLAALHSIVLDADEKRVALAVLTDTSRDGSFDKAKDDAAIFVTDAASGSLSFGRAPAALLADEIRPKITAALSVPASALTIASSSGVLRVTVELPWIDDEKPAALVDRLFVAARALAAAVPQREILLLLRLGGIDLNLLRRRDPSGRPYVILVGRGFSLEDREALPLVLKEPARTSSFMSPDILSGFLQNTGAEASPVIEVFTRVGRNYGAERKFEETAKSLGVIPPGKRVPFSLVVTSSYSEAPHIWFRADGKPIEVFNQYTREHSLQWLEAVLAIRAAHGAWVEHAERQHTYWYSPDSVLVHLTPEQAALSEQDRQKLFNKITTPLQAHRRRFHGDKSLPITFAAPDGGGWQLDEAGRIQRLGAQKP